MPVPVPARVLLTTDAVGGVWTYTLELARALRKRGTAIALATMGPRPSPAARRAAARAGARLYESDCRLEWTNAPWDDVARAGAWLLDLERQLHPDIVHLNQFAFGVLRWRVPALVVAHSCVCSWWRAVHGVAAPPTWDRYRRAVRDGLHGAALVVAPTRAMLDALVREYGPLRAAAIIPNGRDPRPFRPAAKQELIVSVGRLWDEAKNIAALARAAPGLDWPVYVAGETRHPDGREPALRGLHALGPLPPAGVARWLRRAAIYALPARYEPFGLSVLEAAYAGCALVLGDVPSLRELWDGAALFVPPNDADALHRALRALIRRAPLRRALAHRARARARRFGAARCAAAYLAAYRRLGAGDRAGIARQEVGCAS